MAQKNSLPGFSLNGYNIKNDLQVEINKLDLFFHNECFLKHEPLPDKKRLIQEMEFIAIQIKDFLSKSGKNPEPFIKKKLLNLKLKYKKLKQTLINIITIEKMTNSKPTKKHFCYS